MRNDQAWTRPRTDTELKDALKRQIGHLRRSARAYDEGFVEEAERLASCAYILLHHGTGRRSNKSLLRALDLIDELQFPDTRDLKYRAGLPLCYVDPGRSDLQYRPRFEMKDGGYYPLIGFEEWWGQEIYAWRTSPLRRQDFVLALRDNDGGGHVDAIANDLGYERLKALGMPTLQIHEGKIGIRMRHGGPGLQPLDHFASINEPIKNAHWASMRQIAGELDVALEAVGY